MNTRQLLLVVIAASLGVGLLSIGVIQTSNSQVAQQSSPVIKAYFTSQLQGDCGAPGAFINPVCVILDLMKSARKRVLIAMYESKKTENDPLGNQLRMDLLDAVKNLSVPVYVLLGNDNSLNSSSDEKVSEYLGKQVICTSTIHQRKSEERVGMHHKFIVIDDQIVITGSLNWNGSSIENNTENIIVIESAQLAWEFAEEFRRIWGCASFE